jgi:hypothetical protein
LAIPNELDLTIRGLEPKQQNEILSFAKLILAYGMGEYHLTLLKNDVEKAKQLLFDAIMLIQEGISLLGVSCEQSLRATNRLADFVGDYQKLGGEKVNHIKPLVLFEYIERERLRLNSNEANPWAARFYFSFGNYLAATNINRAIEKYAIAHKILCDSATDGVNGEFTLFAKNKMDALKAKAALDTGSSVSSSASVMTFGGKPATTVVAKTEDEKQQDKRMKLG